MTAEEYQKAKQQIAEYERLADLRDTYTIIKNSADMVVIRCDDGREIVLEGAEPIAAVQDYVLQKLSEIDNQKERV